MYSVHKYKTAVRNTAVIGCRKSLFLKQTSNLLSLSPCPLSPGKGDFTGATAPSPSKDACSQPHKATARCGGTNGRRPVRGLRPCDPIFNKQEVYRQTKTAVRNTAVIGCRKSLFLKQTSKQLQSPTIVGSVKPSNRTSPFFEGGHGCPKLNAQSFAGRKTNRAFIKRQG